MHASRGDGARDTGVLAVSTQEGPHATSGAKQVGPPSPASSTVTALVPGVPLLVPLGPLSGLAFTASGSEPVQANVATTTVEKNAPSPAKPRQFMA